MNTPTPKTDAAEKKANAAEEKVLPPVPAVETLEQLRAKAKSLIADIFSLEETQSKQQAIITAKKKEFRALVGKIETLAMKDFTA